MMKNNKLKTISHAQEILIAASDWIGEETSHERIDDIVEFARGAISYRVEKNGYIADVLVGIKKTALLFYMI